MSAQYGNSAGSVTNLITKSGTNQYHGSGWYFGRNDYLRRQQLLRQPDGNPATGTSLQPVRRDLRRRTHQGQALFLPVLPGQPLYRISTAHHGHGGVSGISASGYYRAAQFSRGLAIQELRANVPADIDPIDLETYYRRPRSRGGGHSSGYLCPDNSNALIASRMAAIIGVTAEDQAAMATRRLRRNPGASGRYFRPHRSSVPTQHHRYQRFAKSEQLLEREICTTDGKPPDAWTTTFCQGSVVCAVCLEPVAGQFRSFPTRTTVTVGERVSSIRSCSGIPTAKSAIIHTFSPSVLNEFRAGYA